MTRLHRSRRGPPADRAVAPAPAHPDRRRGVSGAARLLALTVAATPAVASAAPPTAEIQQRLDRAVAHIRSGDCGSALTEMRPVDAAVRARGDLPAFRWNFAWCLEQTGDVVGAAEAYTELLALDPPAQLRGPAAERLAALDAQRLARLEVDCAPADATVRLGAGDALPCPASWPRVAAGAQTLVVRAPSGLEHSHTVDAPAGRATMATLEVPAAVAVESPGFEATVEIDGEAHGVARPTAPLHIDALAPGTHIVRAVDASRGLAYVTERTVAPGERLTVDLSTLDGQPIADGGDDTWLWVGVGATAAVGIGVGVWLLTASDDGTDPRAVDFRGEE